MKTNKPLTKSPLVGEWVYTKLQTTSTTVQEQSVYVLSCVHSYLTEELVTLVPLSSNLIITLPWKECYNT
jgi:hypothetical protein